MDSINAKLEKLNAAWQLAWLEAGFSEGAPEIEDATEDYFVISNNGVYYQIPYQSNDDENITVAKLPQWFRVERVVTWEPADLPAVQNADAIRALDVLTFGGSVKALGNGVTGGYLVRFTDPGQVDLAGDYFDSSTDFELDDGKGTSPAYYQHGQDNVLKRRRLGERATIGVDEVGVWIEHQLDLRNKYESAIYQMAEAGKLGWSSGTASHLVERVPVNERAAHIKKWPLGIDASYTPTPCDPGNTITVKSWLESAKTAAPVVAEAPVINNITINDTNLRGTTMSDNNEMEAKLTSLDARLTEVLAQLAKTPAMRGTLVAPDSETDHPETKSFADFLVAVAHGNTKRLASVYKSVKDMTEGVGVQGGYTIPHEYGNRLLEMMSQQSGILSRVAVQNVGAPSGEFPVLDQFAAPTAGAGNTAFAGGVTAAVTAESAVYTETQATFETLQWRLNKVGGFVEVSNELLEDSLFDIENMLSNLFRIAIQNRNERNVIRGTGVGEPLGILNSSAAVAVTVDTNNTFALADALEMLTRFKSFSGQGVWIIHPSVWAEIGAFAVTTGSDTTYLGSLNAGNPQAPLLGYPIVTSEHMPGKISGIGYDRVILADLGAYLWFQRRDIQIAFSEHAAFTYGKGTFRFDQRVDGKPWLRTAITDANPQGSFTMSPFVYLDD